MTTTAAQIGGPYLFLCPHCPKEFKDKEKARRHIATHDPKQYSCSACGKLFRAFCRFIAAGGVLNSSAATRDKLFVHSRTMHSGQWRKCNYCDRKCGFHAFSGLRRSDESEGFVR